MDSISSTSTYGTSQNCEISGKNSEQLVEKTSDIVDPESHTGSYVPFKDCSDSLHDDIV